MKLDCSLTLFCVYSINIGIFVFKLVICVHKKMYAAIDVKKIGVMTTGPRLLKMLIQVAKVVSICNSHKIKIKNLNPFLYDFLSILRKKLRLF